jgi:hypothetical protein
VHGRHGAKRQGAGLTEGRMRRRGKGSRALAPRAEVNVLPGVELIPGMVVAIEQAQTTKMSYHRQ